MEGVEFGDDHLADKEAYRWNFLIGNARSADDFSRIINLNETYRLTGAAFNSAIVNAIDVDQWLRASAALSLAGIGDNYITSSGAWHNLKLYHRSDGRILYLPWDLDFQTRPYDDPLIINPDIAALTAISPAYLRLFYQHLQDIIRTSFNTTYLTPWVNHYSTLQRSGGNWNDILTYVDQRAAYVQTQINSAYPPVAFKITSPNSSTSASSTTLTGNGGLDVRTIVVQMGEQNLPVTWINANTWQVTVPIAPGSNVITLQAFDYHGNLVGSDMVTITGTGSVIPAAAGNLVVSEIHYNPSAPTGSELNASSDNNEFEFVELRNISATETISLAGCRFTGGLDYTFPNITLAPGAYAVVPRNTSVFAARYPGVPTLPHYFQSGGNFLGNGGDDFTLVGANAAQILRISYGDSDDVRWPASADGGGPSLVLIAPLANPDPGDPLHWRASSAIHGNPGTTDALSVPAVPLGDENRNGLSNLVDYAVGAGVMPSVGSETIGGLRYLNFTLERNPLADANWTLEHATSLTEMWNPAGANLTITARTVIPGGRERIILRATTPLNGSSEFLRAKLTVP